MNLKDLDFGSGGVTLLPTSLKDAAGNPMLVVGGKEGRLYLIDCDNLGKFNDTYPTTGNPDPRLYDRVLGEYPYDGLNNSGKDDYSSVAYFSTETFTPDSGKQHCACNSPSPSSLPGTVPPGTAPRRTPARFTRQP